MTHSKESRKQQLLKEFFLNASLIALLKQVASETANLQRLERSPSVEEDHGESETTVAA